MCEFDLQRAFLGLGAASEDFEDETGAIQHFRGPCLLQIALLDRRQRAIDDDEPRVVRLHQRSDFLDLALTEISRGAQLIQRGDDGVGDVEINGARETRRLFETGSGIADRAGSIVTRTGARAAIGTDHEGTARAPEYGVLFSAEREPGLSRAGFQLSVRFQSSQQTTTSI